MKPRNYEFRNTSKERFRAFERYCELGDDLPCVDSCANIPTEENPDGQVTSDVVIAAISTYRVWKTSPFVMPGYECGLCQERFKEGDYVKCLPCKHKFHTYCIENWLKWVRSRCPIDKLAASRSSYEDPTYVIEEEDESQLRSQVYTENNCNTSLGENVEQTRIMVEAVQNLPLKNLAAIPSNTKIFSSPSKVECSSALFRKSRGRRVDKAPPPESSVQDLSCSNAEMEIQKNTKDYSRRNFRSKEKTGNPAVLRDSNKNSFVEERYEQRKAKPINSSSKQISSRLLKLSEPRKSVTNVFNTARPPEILSPMKPSHSDTATSRLTKSWGPKKYKNFSKDISSEAHFEGNLYCSNAEMKTQNDLNKYAEKVSPIKAITKEPEIPTEIPRSLLFEELHGQRKRRNLGNSLHKHISTRLLKLSEHRRPEANLVYALRPLGPPSPTKVSHSDTAAQRLLKSLDAKKYENYGGTGMENRGEHSADNRAVPTSKLRSSSMCPGKTIQSSIDAVYEMMEYHKPKVSSQVPQKSWSRVGRSTSLCLAGPSSGRNVPPAETQVRYDIGHRENSKQVRRVKTPTPRKKPDLTPRQVLQRCGHRNESQILSGTPVVHVSGVSQIKPPFNRF